MGPFRQERPITNVDNSTNSAKATLGDRNINTRSHRHGGFSFGLWMRLHGVDLITMALMGALGLGIYKARECIYIVVAWLGLKFG